MRPYIQDPFLVWVKLWVLKKVTLIAACVTRWEVTLSSNVFYFFGFLFPPICSGSFFAPSFQIKDSFTVILRFLHVPSQSLYKYITFLLKFLFHRNFPKLSGVITRLNDINSLGYIAAFDIFVDIYLICFVFFNNISFPWRIFPWS